MPLHSSPEDGPTEEIASWHSCASVETKQCTLMLQKVSQASLSPAPLLLLWFVAGPVWPACRGWVSSNPEDQVPFAPCMVSVQLSHTSALPAEEG